MTLIAREDTKINSAHKKRLQPMKILFVISGVYFQEPMGTLQLSAIARKRGHKTDMAVIGLHSVVDAVKAMQPDLIAYSTMSADERMFIKHDNEVKEYLQSSGKNILRIMGGPHPTYFQNVLNTMDLDAICVGEGELAFTTILERVENNDGISGIPNVMCRGETTVEKQVVDDLDSLPFVDRALFYRARPTLSQIAMRSFLAGRGCPFQCSYCFNHAYNTMFKKAGKIHRRRSVDNLIEEIKYVKKYFPPLRFVKFADDVFIFNKSPWLEEFAEKYRREISLPFYCLMRSNVLTEDVAQLLSYAGCKSIGMALEAGNPDIRNIVLKRNLSNEVIMKSFELAAKYNITTYGGIIIGVPGSKLEDDFQSVLFAKKVKLTVPVFNICAPYAGTDITKYAVENGYLDKDFDRFPSCSEKSVFNCFPEYEKKVHQRLIYLGPLYCIIPFFPERLLRVLARFSLTRIYAIAYSVVSSYVMSRKIVPTANTKNPITWIKVLMIYFRYWFQGLKTEFNQEG